MKANSLENNLKHKAFRRNPNLPDFPVNPNGDPWKGSKSQGIWSVSFQSQNSPILIYTTPGITENVLQKVSKTKWLTNIRPTKMG